jgi:hypothetical protein
VIEPLARRHTVMAPDSNSRRSRAPVSSTPRRRVTDRRQPPTGSARGPAQPGRADHRQPSRARPLQARDVLPRRVGAAAACGQRHPANGAPPRRAAPRDAQCLAHRSPTANPDPVMPGSPTPSGVRRARRQSCGIRERAWA